MAGKRTVLWKYAPLWSVAFAAAATMTKSLGQRYILKRTWDFRWSDVGAAVLGAVIGYASFRFKYGEMHDQGHWYTR